MCPPNETDTTYYWYVRARSACGLGPPGTTWSYNTGRSPHAGPVNIAPGDGVSCQGMSSYLDWSDVSRVTSFDVYWGPQDPPPFWQNVTGSRAWPPSQNDTRYYWYIQARNACGDGPAGPTWMYTTGGPPTAHPTSLAPENGADCQPTTTCLGWNAVPGANSYDLFWGTAAPPPYWGNIVGNTACPPSDSGRAYYWFVKTRNGCGPGPPGSSPRIRPAGR